MKILNLLMPIATSLLPEVVEVVEEALLLCCVEAVEVMVEPRLLRLEEVKILNLILQLFYLLEMKVMEEVVVEVVEVKMPKLLMSMAIETSLLPEVIDAVEEVSVDEVKMSQIQVALLLLQMEDLFLQNLLRLEVYLLLMMVVAHLQIQELL